MSSNSRELYAVFYSAMAAVSHLRDSAVCIENANSTTMVYVKPRDSWQSIKITLSGLPSDHRLSADQQVRDHSLSSRGVEDRPADLLRQCKRDFMDLKLGPKFFLVAEQRWVRHTVDLHHPLDRFVLRNPVQADGRKMTSSSPAPEKTNGTSKRRPSSLVFSICSLVRG